MSKEICPECQGYGDVGFIDVDPARSICRLCQGTGMQTYSSDAAPIDPEGARDKAARALDAELERQINRATIVNNSGNILFLLRRTLNGEATQEEFWSFIYECKRAERQWRERRYQPTENWEHA